VVLSRKHLVLSTALNDVPPAGRKLDRMISVVLCTYVKLVLTATETTMTVADH
jgi:hypothetical protein